MAEEQKPKRKYTRRQVKPEPLAVYNVLVTVKRGKKVETIYCEATRIENGCLVVVSMGGPQPLVEKTRYIPLGDGEITVCARPRTYYVPATAAGWGATGTNAPDPQLSFTTSNVSDSPRIIAGPLEMSRQAPQAPRAPRDIVERNADGVPVVTAGFMDGSPA